MRYGEDVLLNSYCDFSRNNRNAGVTLYHNIYLVALILVALILKHIANHCNLLHQSVTERRSVTVTITMAMLVNPSRTLLEKGRTSLSSTWLG